MKKIATATLALSIVVTGGSLSAIVAPANASTQISTQISAYDSSKAELLQRINDYRASYGLHPVSLNVNLSSVAQSWSDKTANEGTFKHNPDFATQVTSGYSYVSEIIGANDSPEGIMFGWINSEEHNNVLLEPRATEIGLGYAYQGNPAGEYAGNYYATAVFADYSKQNVMAFPPTFSETHFTIPNTVGVQYRKGRDIIPAGTYPGAGIITISAEPKTGYSLLGPYVWSHTFPEPTPVPTPAPAPVPEPLPVPAPAPVKDRFVDINAKSGFYTEIMWLADRGITTGWSDGTFRPYETTNRETMAAFLYRFAGSPAYTPPVKRKFTDVTTSSPFYKEISWLADQGITTGWSDGSFRPGQAIPRDAMAAFLYRFAGSPAYTPPAVSRFTDVSTTSPFYKEISWLAAQGITTGWADGSFRPSQPITRDAMAAFLYRFDQKNLRP